MKNIVYIATSIDGYIATPEGGLEWLENIPNPEKSDFGYNDFIDSIDGVVMGKNTFEKVLSFGSWPYNKKVFVLKNFFLKFCYYLHFQVHPIFSPTLKHELTLHRNKIQFRGQISI